MPVVYFKNAFNSIVYNDTFNTIIFEISDFHWQHETLLNVVDEFFTLMNTTTQIEAIKGADRMSVRFRYHQEEFILHVESICESIWIEHYSSHDESLIIMLYQEIKRLLHRS